MPRGPRVVSTSPASLSEDQPRNGDVHFTFDRPLDPATITGSAIELRSGSVRQGGDIAYDPVRWRLSFLTRGAFRESIAYDAELNQELRGLRQGLPIEAEVLTFVTTTDYIEDDPVEAPSYLDDIRPIFDNGCAFSGCHGGDEPAVGMDLSAPDTIATTAFGIGSRQWAGWPRIDPWSGAWSYLIYKINGEATIRGARMPPGAPLSQGEIEAILGWIEAGAKVDRASDGP